jgi:VIT1/CCC1 family predicted Fe2+/Mn2+ transporter
MSKYRKAVVAACGAALTIIPAAFGSASWAAPVIAALTALAVYLTPNAPKVGPKP